MDILQATPETVDAGTYADGVIEQYDDLRSKKPGPGMDSWTVQQQMEATRDLIKWAQDRGTVGPLRSCPKPGCAGTIMVTAILDKAQGSGGVWSAGHCPKCLMAWEQAP